MREAQEEFLRRDSDIRNLESALDEERRKSMLDEERIRSLESKLEDKVREAGDNYKNYMSLQRKSELTADEIERLKAEMEKERRQTMADQQFLNKKLRDMESENERLKNQGHSHQNEVQKSKSEAK